MYLCFYIERANTTGKAVDIKGFIPEGEFCNPIEG